MPINRRMKLVVPRELIPVNLLPPHSQKKTFTCEINTRIDGSKYSLPDLQELIFKQLAFRNYFKCSKCAEFMDSVYKRDGHGYCSKCIITVSRTTSNGKKAEYSEVLTKISQFFKDQDEDDSYFILRNFGQYEKGVTRPYDMCLCLRCNRFMDYVFKLYKNVYCFPCARALFAIDQGIRFKYDKEWTLFTRKMTKRPEKIILEYPPLYL